MDATKTCRSAQPNGCSIQADHDIRRLLRLVNVVKNSPISRSHSTAFQEIMLSKSALPIHPNKCTGLGFPVCFGAQSGTHLPHYKCFGKHEIYCIVSYFGLYLQEFANGTVLSLFVHGHNIAAVWGTTTPDS